MKKFNRYFNLIINEKDKSKNDPVLKDQYPISKKRAEYGGVKCTEWRRQNGHRHREDGPAIEWDDGSESWYKNNGLHREDGPAVIDKREGKRVWWVDDRLHREDGPAVEWDDDNRENEWYLYHIQVTPQDVMRRYPQNFRKSQVMDKLI